MHRSWTMSIDEEIVKMEGKLISEDYTLLSLWRMVERVVLLFFFF